MGAGTENMAEEVGEVRTEKKVKIITVTESYISRVNPIIIIGRQVPHIKEIRRVGKKMKMSRRCVLQTRQPKNLLRREQFSKISK